MANFIMKFFAKTPQLLYSYLATEMLGPFFASFIIMNCVFFLVKLIPFLNFVLELNIGFSDFIRLFSYLFPNIFLYSIPMAAMMGVIIGFARLSNDSEILALKASGISMYQILPPVIIVATLIALLTSFISIKLIPSSTVAMKQLSYELLKEKISNGIKEHVFTEALGDVVVYVNKIDKITGEWSDVWVSDMRGVDNPIVTMASTGEMNSSLGQMMVSIVLRNGSLHKPDYESAQIVRFDQYRINIPLQIPETKATRQKKSALTLKELLQEAEEEKEDILNTRKVLIEYHKRLVLPVGCLMMSLIGLPLGLQARPGKKAIGIQAGLAIFILYYILFTFGKDMAEEGFLPVWLAMWSPNILFFSLALFWIFRIANEQSLIPAACSNVFNKMTTVISIPLKTVYQRIFHKIPTSTETILYEKTVDLTPGTAIKGNAKSMVFHVPACENYNCRHCTLEFKNIHVAREAGFEPCRICKELIDTRP
jgi:lipopolysaccharide export system permease protein